MRPQGIYKALEKTKVVVKWCQAAKVGEEIKLHGRWMEITDVRWQHRDCSHHEIVLGVKRKNGEFWTVKKLAVQDSYFRVPLDYDGIGDTI